MTVPSTVAYVMWDLTLIETSSTTDGLVVTDQQKTNAFLVSEDFEPTEEPTDTLAGETSEPLEEPETEFHDPGEENFFNAIEVLTDEADEDEPDYSEVIGGCRLA